MGYAFQIQQNFNRYTNLDNIEWHIIDYLANSTSKYAVNLWKILKYNTNDCLSQEDLTYDEKIALVYTGNGDSTESYRVFLTPYVDDSWKEQTSHLHIYVKDIIPTNHITSVVTVCIECIVHNKILNIIGDASKFNTSTNPAEMSGNTILTPYKNRDTVMLKSVIAELNGKFINGVGLLQLNVEMAKDDGAKANIWDGKSFVGHKIVMSTIMSGSSDDSNIGY